jgi:hypothetical protein
MRAHSAYTLVLWDHGGAWLGGFEQTPLTATMDSR